MSLPSKLTSYRAAGRPVLAAVAAGGATAEALGSTANAVRIEPGSPHSMVDAALVLGAGPASGVRPAADVGSAGAAWALRGYEHWLTDVVDRGRAADRRRGQ